MADSQALILGLHIITLKVLAIFRDDDKTAFCMASKTWFALRPNSDLIVIIIIIIIIIIIYYYYYYYYYHYYCNQ